MKNERTLGAVDYQQLESTCNESLARIAKIGHTPSTRQLVMQDCNDFFCSVNSFTYILVVGTIIGVLLMDEIKGENGSRIHSPGGRMEVIGHKK